MKFGTDIHLVFRVNATATARVSFAISGRHPNKKVRFGFQIQNGYAPLSSAMIQMCVKHVRYVCRTTTRLWEGHGDNFCSHLTNSTNVVISSNCCQVCSVEVEPGSVCTCWIDCRLHIAAQHKCVSMLDHELSIMFTHDSLGLTRLVMNHEVSHFVIFYKVAVVSF